jgi:hypothetical protein
LNSTFCPGTTAGGEHPYKLEGRVYMIYRKASNRTKTFLCTNKKPMHETPRDKDHREEETIFLNVQAYLAA